MTKVCDFFPMDLMNDSLGDATSFVCGTEYEIESVKTIKLPGHSVMVRDQLSLNENQPYWVGDIGLVHDGSLRNGGLEFITRPVNYARALSLFETLHKGLTLGENPYSNRTSIHVHVNMASLSMEQLKHFLLTYALLEPVFFEVAGDTRKHNIHCVPLSFTILPTHYKKTAGELVKLWSKYSALNLVPIKTQGTVEFRHLYGTGSEEVYEQWLTLIKELWDWVYQNDTTALRDMLMAGLTPRQIQLNVMPSSFALSPDFSDSLIDVKLAF